MKISGRDSREWLLYFFNVVAEMGYPMFTEKWGLRIKIKCCIAEPLKGI